MTDLLLVERAKTADELNHAAWCIQHLEIEVLPTCKDDRERACVRSAIDGFKREARRLGERMLQLALSSTDSHASKN